MSDPSQPVGLIDAVAAKAVSADSGYLSYLAALHERVLQLTHRHGPPKLKRAR
jgi:hypothetical protein